MSVLTDFLTGIANAIRTKKCTTDTILASDFANEITNLPSGGGDLAGIVSGTATSVTIPDGATAIRDYAFYNYTNLTSVVIPNGVTSIGISAFFGCSNLVGEITIPNTVTSIGNAAFYGCSKITHVTLPNNITRIEQNSFYQCYALQSVIIPSMVTFIDNGAFRYCSSLIDVLIPNSVASLGGDSVFANCTNLKNVVLGSGFNCNNLKLSASTQFTADTIVSMLNALADRTGQTAYTLTLGSTNLAKLSAAQIAIATQKNWNLA